MAPHAVREKLVLASEAAILSPSNMSQMAISSYLDHFDWQGQIKAFREQYRERRDAMISALQEHIPSATWNVPDGGFYVWVKLPEGLDSKSMLPRAVTARVAYVAGTAFFTDGSGAGHMRLSYCYPTPDRIREGVARLATWWTLNSRPCASLVPRRALRRPPSISRHRIWRETAWHCNDVAFKDLATRHVTDRRLAWTS